MVLLFLVMNNFYWSWLRHIPSFKFKTFLLFKKQLYVVYLPTFHFSTQDLSKRFLLKALIKDEISNKKLIFSICIFLTEIYIIEFLRVYKTDMKWVKRSSCSLVTGRKLNVHKTFRRRPGRLLNVLCTFNLRPASTGCSLVIC